MAKPPRKPKRSEYLTKADYMAAFRKWQLEDMPAYNRAEAERQLAKQRAQEAREREAGWGTVDGRPAYYEVGNEDNPNRVDVFPDGIPRGHHTTIPHGHYVIKNGEPTHIRESDGTELYDEKPGDIR